ncbi:MAG: hypothetical protein H6Q67_1787 [Firmicutes bacterium]|nr:hypothetical protein [Bacillota bacterium]
MSANRRIERITALLLVNLAVTFVSYLLMLIFQTSLEHIVDILDVLPPHSFLFLSTW